MLPFLKPKKASVAGVIIQQRKPDNDSDSKDLDEKEYNLEDCAQKIINAIHGHDKKGLAEALKEAFQKLESEPHVEGEHIEPHSYEAQNIKAGEE